MNAKISGTALSDEELVTKLLSTGNSALFSILYDRYCDVVYSKCYSFADSSDEAKDLTQEVFLKLYIKLGSFKGMSKFSTWLYAFTYNYCVNYVSRDRAKRMKRNSVSADDYQHLQVEVDDHSLFQLKVDKLKRGLELIPPEDKMILLLKYQDDVSIKDLCLLLKINESAVKMRLKRAKAKLIQVCNEQV